MGAKIPKDYSSYKSGQKFSNLLNFHSIGPQKNCFLDLWNFELPIFNDFLFRKLQIYHCMDGEIKNLSYLENERP